MKNLELMGVRELDAVEMRNENGGFIWIELWGGINMLRLNPKYPFHDSTIQYA
jgi:hypothetical protein